MTAGGRGMRWWAILLCLVLATAGLFHAGAVHGAGGHRAMTAAVDLHANGEGGCHDNALDGSEQACQGFAGCALCGPVPQAFVLRPSGGGALIRAADRSPQIAAIPRAHPPQLSVRA